MFRRDRCIFYRKAPQGTLQISPGQLEEQGKPWTLGEGKFPNKVRFDLRGCISVSARDLSRKPPASGTDRLSAIPKARVSRDGRDRCCANSRGQLALDGSSHKDSDFACTRI